MNFDIIKLILHIVSFMMSVRMSDVVLIKTNFQHQRQNLVDIIFYYYYKSKYLLESNY
jgi:hypothetical protein